MTQTNNKRRTASWVVDIVKTHLAETYRLLEAHEVGVKRMKSRAADIEEILAEIEDTGGSDNA